MTVPFTLITREGSRHDLAGEAGLSVMEVLRQANLGDLKATCGGACSCATCHVYVDTASWPLLDGLSQDEEDLLDFTDSRAGGSRLSCQIRLHAGLAGMEIRVAPEED